MRFKRLQIPAYGPFTDFSLDLPKGETDFHLIYGPNEAGKSSFLRAIRSLLFGIPAKTTDNFHHDYKKLRILAELEDSLGSSHIFQRRKGNKDTLLDAAGNPTPDANLQRILGVVDETYFNSMFGLGSEELRQGAGDLLRGEGRLGEALFSASLGGTPVDKVIQALETEAGEIFAGRAARRIRLAAKLHTEKLRAKKDALIKPETWEEVEQGLRDAEAQLASLKAANQGTVRRKEWLERCRSALPMVGQLTERRTMLAALPNLPDLPSSFAVEIRQARSTWSTASKEIDRLGEELARLQIRANECQLNPAALALESTIDAVHTRLGAYRENLQTLATKQAAAQAKEAAVKRNCQDLGITVTLEKLESLRITQPQFAEAADKAKQLDAATGSHHAAIQKEKDLAKELDRLRSAPTTAHPETHAVLKNLLAGISTTETIAMKLGPRQTARVRLERSLRDLHGSLSGAPSDLEATRSLKLPSRATIERFREDFAEAARAIRDLTKDKQASEQKIRELQAEMERRTRQGDLPSLDDLTASRSHRERGWALVLEDWKGRGAKQDFVAGKPLEDAYPEAVSAADSIADRLRSAAEAVAQMEELRSKLNLEQSNLQAIEARKTAAEASTAETHSDWIKKWYACHPAPASPQEMLEWCETWQEFGRQWDQHRADQEQLEIDQQRVSEAIAELAKALKSDASDFQEVLDQARNRLEDLDAARIESAKTEGLIQNAASALVEIRKELPNLKVAEEAAQQEWERCRKSLVLAENHSPSSQIETLRARREMFQDFNAWKALLSECDTLKQRIEDYESEINEMATKLRLSADGTEAREKALWSALETAKSIQATFEDLKHRITELSDDQAAARATVIRTRTEFDALLAQAELTDESKLDTLLAHFEEHRTLREKVQELRDGLAGLSHGLAVDEFVTRVEAEDVEDLEAAIAELEDALEEDERKIAEVRSKRQEWDGQRKTMDTAQDEAARHEQEAAFAVSSMEADAERFVRLRVAIHLLRGQIDAFRQQNQGPFMEKAGRWFSEVTGGAFSGVVTSFTDGDEPVIAGQRAGGMDAVLVPGMSEGTRDQLYLALRLAGLELHLEDHEPMPMILDDLLVHFDDGRATNVLRALSNLAQRSQVLLFTHHAHIVELAQSQLESGSFKLHQFR